MPLIIEDILRRGASPQKGVSPMYISVYSKYLSRQYNLLPSTKYWVEGEILGVSRVLDTLSDEEKEILEKYVVGRSVKFYLIVGILIPYDHFYFDEDSWSILRDVGVFPDEYKLRVKLSKLIVETEGKTINLYPYRDVIAV